LLCELRCGRQQLCQALRVLYLVLFHGFRLLGRGQRHSLGARMLFERFGAFVLALKFNGRYLVTFKPSYDQACLQYNAGVQMRHRRYDSEVLDYE